MSNMTSQVHLELELCVAFDYTAGSPAVMTLPNGDPGYPAEGAEVDITAVYLERINKDGATERLDIQAWLHQNDLTVLEYTAFDAVDSEEY